MKVDNSAHGQHSGVNYHVSSWPIECHIHTDIRPVSQPTLALEESRRLCPCLSIHITVLHIAAYTSPSERTTTPLFGTDDDHDDGPAQ